MKEFYTNLGVDIFKDAVSLPGVSQQYILRKTLQGRKGYKPPELYAPNKEAYDMLKAAVVRGSESCIHAQARGGRDTHPLPPIRGRAACQAYPGVRRQFPVPQHHDEGDALRSWSRYDLQQPRGCGDGFSPSYVQRGVVRVRGGGHRSPQGVVARVRGGPAALHQPQRPRLLVAEAHARLPEAQRAQALP